MNRSLIVLLFLAMSSVALAAGDAHKPKVEPLLKEASVKVVRVTISPGSTLPEHTTPVHATVAAMSGEGRVTIGKKTTALPLHGAVFLPKKIPHSVINTGKTPLVLIVHHLLTTK